MVSVAEPQVETSGDSRAVASERAAQRRRRVLMIGESLPIGADRRSWHQAASLRDAGFQVSIAAPHGESRIVAYPGLAGVTVLPCRQFFAPADSAARTQLRRAETLLLARMILQETFRAPGFALLCIAQPPVVALPLARLGKLLGKHILLDYRVPAPEAVLQQGGVEDSEGYRAARRLEDKLLSVSDRILCANRLARDALVERSTAHADEFVLVRTGVDPSLTVRGTTLPDPNRGHRYSVAYAGALTAFSGADLFVRAARRIVYGIERTDILFTLAGSGPEAAAIRDLVFAEGLKDYVHCVPGDDPALMAGLLSTADLAVDPSPGRRARALVSNRPLLNYQLHGVPTVAFGQANLSETFSAVALAVPEAGGIPALAQGILEALAKPLPRILEPTQRMPKSLLWANDGAPAFLAAVRSLVNMDEPIQVQGSAVEAG